MLHQFGHLVLHASALRGTAVAVALSRPRAVGEVMSQGCCRDLLRLDGAAQNLAFASTLVRAVPVLELVQWETFEAWAHPLEADVCTRIGAPLQG